MKALRFTCKTCGPAGYSEQGNVKVCNNCGATKRFNKRQQRPAPTTESLVWLGCGA